MAAVRRSGSSNHVELPLIPSEFLRWIDTLSAFQIPIWNSPDVIRWNMDKRYLLSLAAAGVAVPEMVIAPQGTTLSLANTLANRGWPAAVVKPTISANAFETICVTPENVENAQHDFDQLVRHRDMVVQKLLPEIAFGELSLMFIGNQFSHAVKKLPATGEFRVQERHGGTLEPYTPAMPLIDTCSQLLRLLPGPTLYARVDVVATGHVTFLMEIEAIEPSLFFGFGEGSPHKFVSALSRLLARS
jgi:glutathione synthase/RimK-type ligase-like ATP-grasp enzyme